MRWFSVAASALVGVAVAAAGCAETERPHRASAGSGAGGAESGGGSISTSAISTAAGAGSATGGSAGSASSGGASGDGAGGVGGRDLGDAGATNAAGASGRKDCNAGHVVCRVQSPACSEGYVPSVEDRCWGDCVAVERCACAVQADCPDIDKYTCWAREHCGPYVR